MPQSSLPFRGDYDALPGRSALKGARAGLGSAWKPRVRRAPEGRQARYLDNRIPPGAAAVRSRHMDEIKVEFSVELDGWDEAESMAREAADCLERAIELLGRLDGHEITVRCRPSLPETSSRKTDTSSAASEE